MLLPSRSLSILRTEKYESIAWHQARSGPCCSLSPNLANRSRNTERIRRCNGRANPKKLLQLLYFSPRMQIRATSQEKYLPFWAETREHRNP